MSTVASILKNSPRQATSEGILAVLDTLNVKLHQLLAVVTVGTSGCRCLADRRPAILF
jgi:hypothetical protein